MNAKQISAAIIAGDLSAADFNEIVNAINFARAQLGKQVKRTLRIGATVKYRSTKMGGEVTGTVKKIAIKFVTVDCGALGLWRVPANQLEAV